MQCEILPGDVLMITRDEKDKPKQPRSLEHPKNAAEYNAQRHSYSLHFSDPAEAKAALAKVNSIGDFDKAAAWLDKQ